MVNDDFVQQQRAEFTTSDDQNTEHYRYGAFRAILRGHDALPDHVIGHYIELAELEADLAMAGNALADLIHWRGLTEQQREQMFVHPAFAAPFPAFAAPFLQKGIIRSRLLRRLKREPLTVALFEECLAEKDGVLQRVMLEASSIVPLPNGRRKKARVRSLTRACRSRCVVELGGRDLLALGGDPHAAQAQHQEQAEGDGGGSFGNRRGCPINAESPLADERHPAATNIVSGGAVVLHCRINPSYSRRIASGSCYDPVCPALRQQRVLRKWGHQYLTILKCLRDIDTGSRE